MTTIDAAPDSGRAGLTREGDRRTTAAVRLAVGFFQGVVMWALFEAAGGSDGRPKVWPATDPLAYAPIFLVTGYMSVVVLAAVGRLRLRTLLIWVAAAALVLAGLAWHDMARRTLAAGEDFSTPGLMAFAAAALFIGHHLIVPADRERRLVAGYDGYFDAAWMAGVQLALSLAFTGAFWLMLLLGAALFNVIGLRFLGDLITEPVFAFPVTGLAFATAVQLTDVRDGLIRGVRTVALMLLSWLLLVLTVLVAGFLAALPFTGLDGLWETGSATALVLSATGALIILINTAYQDGREDNLPPAVLRAAVRVASVLLTPLIVIAVWGLMLRIGQHGLTPERIIACACTLVGALYAAGYGLGALVPFVRRGSPWMKALEPTNIAAAVLSVLVILALFSPLADPARLSVADQMARLAGGKVAPSAFDYVFLQSGSGRVGQAALARLAGSNNSAIADRARRAQAGEAPNLTPAFRPVIGVLPGGAALPDPFFQIVGAPDAREQCRAAGDCLAAFGPSVGLLEGDILLVQSATVTVYTEDAEYGTWWSRGAYTSVVCEGDRAIDARDLLRQGRLKAVEPGRPALDIGQPIASELVVPEPPRC